MLLVSVSYFSHYLNYVSYEVFLINCTACMMKRGHYMGQLVEFGGKIRDTVSAKEYRYTKPGRAVPAQKYLYWVLRVLCQLIVGVRS